MSWNEQSGNEPRGTPKGNCKGWSVRVIPSFPTNRTSKQSKASETGRPPFVSFFGARALERSVAQDPNYQLSTQSHQLIGSRELTQGN